MLRANPVGLIAAGLTQQGHAVASQAARSSQNETAAKLWYHRCTRCLSCCLQFASSADSRSRQGASATIKMQARLCMPIGAADLSICIRFVSLQGHPRAGRVAARGNGLPAESEGTAQPLLDCLQPAPAPCTSIVLLFGHYGKASGCQPGRRARASAHQGRTYLASAV